MFYMLELKDPCMFFVLLWRPKNRKKKIKRFGWLAFYAHFLLPKFSG